MGRLHQTIRDLAARGDYAFGFHARQRLRERHILHWQVVEGLSTGVLLAERPSTLPNPSIEVEQILPDGTIYKAVWAHLAATEVAKLVTVHFYDGSE